MPDKKMIIRLSSGEILACAVIDINYFNSPFSMLIGAERYLAAVDKDGKELIDDKGEKIIKIEQLGDMLINTALILAVENYSKPEQKKEQETETLGFRDMFGGQPEEKKGLFNRSTAQKYSKKELEDIANRIGE